MNILYITTSYPPFYDMGTIRNQKIINGLISRNHKVTVLSPDNKSDDVTEEIINGNLREWRTKRPFFYNVREKLDGGNKLLLKIWNVIGGKFFFPDTFAFWTFKALKFLKKKDTDGFDIIISSSGSYLSHVIANKFAKKHELPWFAYYGDPWSYSGYGKIKKIISYYEKWILKNCNVIALTTHETIECYKCLLKGIRSNIKLVYIPCGYDTVMKLGNTTSVKPVVLEVVYTGVAYSNDRDLTNTILSVSDLSDTTFTIVGSYSDKYQKIDVKPKCINFLGRVTYKESLDIINKAHVLLHIGNYGALQIPGKTYSYLSSCKPILYIKQEKGHDPTLELLKKFKGVYFVNNEVDEIRQAIKFINDNYLKILDQSKERSLDSNLHFFSWDNLSMIFTTEAERLIKTTKRS